MSSNLGWDLSLWAAVFRLQLALHWRNWRLNVTLSLSGSYSAHTSRDVYERLTTEVKYDTEFQSTFVFLTIEACLVCEHLESSDKQIFPLRRCALAGFGFRTFVLATRLPTFPVGVHSKLNAA